MITTMTYEELLAAWKASFSDEEWKGEAEYRAETERLRTCSVEELAAYLKRRAALYDFERLRGSIRVPPHMLSDT